MKRLPCTSVVLLVAPALVAQSAFRLANGLQVRLSENHERPFLELRLQLDVPKGEESPGREGALQVLARVLEAAGAGPYDAAGLQRVLEERGIAMVFQAVPGSFTWIVRCASSHQEEAFSLLAHVLLRPDLSGTHLEAQRARLWRERRAAGMADWAKQRFRWELLEERPEGLPSERSLSELGLLQVGALHRRIVRPERALLLLRGDVNVAQARQLALLHLGVWGPAAEPPLPPATAAGPRAGTSTACLATGQGPPSATLALLLPKDADLEHARLLAELLPRWLQAAPGGTAEGRVHWRGDGRPAILLRAGAESGGDPLALLAGLRAWAARLGARTVRAAEPSLAARLQDSRSRALGDPAAEPRPVPSPEELARLLQAWCRADRQRVLLTGVQEIAADAPVLQGLGAMAWVRTKE